MCIQVLLTAAAIICMFSQVFANNTTTAPKQLVQIKDIICALLLSGAPVDDFDVNTVKKLQKYNVDLENMSEKELSQLCRVQTVTETAVYISPQIESEINYLRDLQANTDDSNNNALTTIQEPIKLIEGSNQNTKFIPTIINRITIRNSPDSYKYKDRSEEKLAAGASELHNKTNIYDIYENTNGDRQNIETLRTLQRTINNYTVLSNREIESKYNTQKKIKEGFITTERFTETKEDNVPSNKSNYQEIINTIGEALLKNDINKIRAYIMNETKPPTTTEMINSTQNTPEFVSLKENEFSENICNNSVCKSNNRIVVDSNKENYNLDINQILNIFKGTRVRKNRVVKSIKKKLPKAAVENTEILRNLLSIINPEKSSTEDKLEKTQNAEKDSTNILNDVLMMIHNKLKRNEDSQYGRYNTDVTDVRNIKKDTSESKETVIFGPDQPNDLPRHVLVEKRSNELLHTMPLRNRNRETQTKKKIGYKQLVHKRNKTVTKINPLIHHNDYPIVQNHNEPIYLRDTAQNRVTSKDDDGDFAIIKIKNAIKGKQYVIDLNLLEADNEDVQNINKRLSFHNETLKQIESGEMSRTEQNYEQPTVVRSQFVNPSETQYSGINLRELIEQVKTQVLNDLKKTTIATTTVQPEIINRETTQKTLQNVRDTNIVIPLPVSSIVEMFTMLKGKPQSTEAPMEQLSENNKKPKQNLNYMNYPFSLTQPYAIQKQGIGSRLNSEAQIAPRTMQTNSNFIPPLPIPIDVRVDDPYRALENQQISVQSILGPQRTRTDERYHVSIDNSPGNQAKQNKMNDDSNEINIKIKEKRKHIFKHEQESIEHDNIPEYKNDAHRGKNQKNHLYRSDMSGEKAFKYSRHREKIMNFDRIDELPQQHGYSDLTSVESRLKHGQINYNKLNYGKNIGKETLAERSKLDNIAQRHQVPMNNINKGRPSTYDDTHFQNFLKTQQKVNDMLEQLLSKNKKHNTPITDVEGI